MIERAKYVRTMPNRKSSLGSPVLRETGIREDKSDRSAANGHCFMLANDPDRPGRLLIGDSKLRNHRNPEISGKRLSVSALVMDVFFEGMRDTKDGRPGKFTYEGLQEAAARGEAVTTAPSRDTLLPQEDLILGIHDNMVILGTQQDGPVFAYTEPEWEALKAGINDPTDRLAEYISPLQPIGLDNVILFTTHTIDVHSQVLSDEATISHPRILQKVG